MSKRTGLGFMIPVVLFVLLFVVCCGILTGVFLRAEAVSRQAGIYNDSVQLCRNQAEICRADGIADGITTYRYDENLQPSDSGIYYVTVDGHQDGALQTATITAFTDTDSEIFSLDVAVCLPEGR